MTHNDLCIFAAKKLRQNHSLIVTEIATSAGEQPDAIGFSNDYTTLIECKTSRSDFLADSKKIFRRIPKLGMGCYRYFLAPHGIINMEELPSKWGLYEIKGKRIYKTVKAAYFSSSERAIKSESKLLLSVIRRIGHTIPEGIGISAKCYTYQTCRTTIGFGI